MILPMGPPYCVLDFDEWLWDPHVEKLKKNIVGMGVHKIVKWMEKYDLENRAKTVTFEKWLTVTPNWRCYRHPLITSPNMGVNLTSFECHEPLFHIYYESLHQTNED
jgi:hypothetical protein